MPNRGPRKWRPANLRWKPTGTARQLLRIRQISELSHLYQQEPIPGTHSQAITVVGSDTNRILGSSIAADFPSEAQVIDLELVHVRERLGDWGTLNTNECN